MVDINVASLAPRHSFEATALETALTSALNSVVNDGKISDYDVDMSGAVEVKSSSFGRHQLVIHGLVSN